MNKKSIFISALFLLIGIAIGVLYYKNYSIKTGTQSGQELIQVKGGKDNTSNQLFALFDSFKDFPGHLNIKEIREDLGLLIVNYTMQEERSEYAIYDYKNDKLYKNIGYAGLGDASTPISFISKNQVLIYTYNEEGVGTYLLSVKDFNNKIIKVLPVKLSYPERVTATLSNSSVDIVAHEKITSYYTLNPATLEVKKN